MDNIIPAFSFEYQTTLLADELRQAFEKVLYSRWYVLGAQCAQFEAEFASYVHTEHCIGVANGLDALHIALKTLNIGPGDEVIVPSNTYVATWLAISYTGAAIVPVEPDAATFNITAEGISAAVTAKTRAIMPVHLFGQACQMDDIMQLAQTRQLFVVEDNAQAQGSMYNNVPTGSFGHINGNSFYPTKNLGALGDAGAITTNSATWADTAKILRNYGSQKRYENELIGLNSRLDEMQAAFLLVKLKYLDTFNTMRRESAMIYDEGLKDTGDLQLPVTAPNVYHVFHQYVIKTQQRDELKAFLSKNGIETIIHYPTPPHLQNAYKYLDYTLGDFPIAEQIAATCLSLPIYPGISKDEVMRVVTTIKRFYA